MLGSGKLPDHRLLLVAVALVGCSACSGSGSGGGSGSSARDGGGENGGNLSLPPLDSLPLGKEDLTGYTYNRKPGVRDTFRKALAAAKQGDFAEVEAACRETLLLEPGHLEASWHLALALARQKRYAEVLDPLSAAVAGDFMRWGERSLIARALTGFRDSPHAARFVDLVARYRDQFRRAVNEGLLVVGRRGRPWYPQSGGEVNLNHRSEIYAYALDAGRYLRVSRTNGSLVGFVRHPAAPEVAYVSYRKVWLPSAKQRDRSAERLAPPTPGSDQPLSPSARRSAYLREVYVGVIDLDATRMSHREVRFTDVQWVELFYAVDGKPKLRARVRRARPARGERLVETYDLDVERGRAEEIADAGSIHELLRVGYDSAELRRPVLDGITADWGGDGSAGAFRIESTRKTITLPGGESAARDSIEWSPTVRRIAFTTAPIDPCGPAAEDRAIKLYVAEAATGKLHPVAAGEGELAPVWLDDARLAYVDHGPSGPMVRLVDVVAGGEVARLETVGGVGTEWLPGTASCRPIATEDDDDGTSVSEEEVDDSDEVTDRDAAADDAKNQPAEPRTTEPQTTDKSPTDKSPTDKPPTDKPPTDKPPTDKRPTDKSPTNKSPTKPTRSE